METATWQCYQSHRCQCVTQHHSSWPSGLDRWQSSTMRSKRPLDSLLRRCGFVSSFVVSCVVLQIVWNLVPGGNGIASSMGWFLSVHRWHRHWHRHRQRWHRQRPWRQPVANKMPCDHERALCASRLCGLKASLLVIFFDFGTPQHSWARANGNRSTGCAKCTIVVMSFLLETSGGVYVSREKTKGAAPK